MVNLNIKTKLGVTPNLDYSYVSCVYVKRGATAELSLDFKNYPYVVLEKVLKDDGQEEYYCNIEQFNYLFKMPSGEIVNYPLFAEANNGDTMDVKHYNIDYENNCLSFIWKSTETAQLPLSSMDEPIIVEAVFKIDTDKLISQNVDSVIIEPQPPIVVIDSLYKESGLADLGKSRGR